MQTEIQRICFTLKVRPERLEEYKRHHEQVWPEMLQALHETGWRNYSLFLRKDGLLVGYLETDDFEASVAGMQRYEVNQRWQETMAPFFENDGRKADEAMKPLAEVFHLD